MKTRLYYMFCLTLLSAITRSGAQTVTSGNVVGYTFGFLQPGENLVSNQFDQELNQLTMLIPVAPVGTTVSLWEPSLNSYAASSTYLETGWSVELRMPTGSGALLDTPSAFTNIWSGTVLGLSNGTVIPPPAFSGPDGTYLLGMLTPVNSQMGEDVFLWTLGRNPGVGESITTLDAITQEYTTTAYLGGGSWDNGVPELGNAESAFFTIPEPSTSALFIISGLSLVYYKRKKYRTNSWTSR